MACYSYPPHLIYKAGVINLYTFSVAPPTINDSQALGFGLQPMFNPCKMIQCISSNQTTIQNWEKLMVKKVFN